MPNDAAAAGAAAHQPIGRLRAVTMPAQSFLPLGHSRHPCTPLLYLYSRVSLCILPSLSTPNKNKTSKRNNSFHPFSFVKSMVAALQLYSTLRKPNQLMRRERIVLVNTCTASNSAVSAARDTPRSANTAAQAPCVCAAAQCAFVVRLCALIKIQDLFELLLIGGATEKSKKQEG